MHHGKVSRITSSSPSKDFFPLAYFFICLKDFHFCEKLQNLHIHIGIPKNALFDATFYHLSTPISVCSYCLSVVGDTWRYKSHFVGHKLWKITQFESAQTWFFVETLHCTGRFALWHKHIKLSQTVMHTAKVIHLDAFPPWWTRRFQSDWPWKRRYKTLF